MEDRANTADLMQGNVSGYSFEGDGALPADELGQELQCTIRQGSTNNTANFTGFVVR